MRKIATLVMLVLLAAAGTARAAPLATEAALKDRILGDPAASVTIIEYASMTCPHCATFHTDTLPELKKKYIDTGKVNLIMRDFPFDRVGLAAAMMARCAPADRYHRFLDVLFETQAQWASDPDPIGALKRIGQLGGLSAADFDACLANEDLMNGIIQGRLDAVNQFDINSTPTFIIGDRVINGAQPFEAFDEVLNQLTD